MVRHEHLRPRSSHALRVPSSYDFAHLAHVELLAPHPEASLDFFVQVMGLTVSAQHGDSSYPRGWDDYEFHTLKLTAATTNGMRHFACRASSEESLRLRVKAVDAAGLGIGWVDDEVAHGPARFPARGANLRRLNHLNLLASRVPPMREFYASTLGCLLTEQIMFDDGSEKGACFPSATRATIWRCRRSTPAHAEGCTI